MSSNIEQIRTRACQSNQRLTQTSLIALMSNTGTVNFLSHMNRDDWEIVSFDAITREVCVRIIDHSYENLPGPQKSTKASGERIVSMIVPEISVR